MLCIHSPGGFSRFAKLSTSLAYVLDSGAKHPQCSFTRPSYDYFNIRICCFEFYNALRYFRISFGLSHFYALRICYSFTIDCINHEYDNVNLTATYVCGYNIQITSSPLTTQRMLNEFRRAGKRIYVKGIRTRSSCIGYLPSLIFPCFLPNYTQALRSSGDV